MSVLSAVSRIDGCPLCAIFATPRNSLRPSFRFNSKSRLPERFCWGFAATMIKDASHGTDPVQNAEAMPQAFAERQAAILDALPATVALLDREGTVVAINGAWRRFGEANGLAAEGACIGSNYLAVCDAAAAQCPKAAAAGAGLRQVLAGERSTFSLDYPCDGPSEARWFRLLAAPLTALEPQENRSGAVVMHVDITDVQFTERMLNQAQKMEAVGQITSGLAHDFNNFLTVIIGNLQLLTPLLRGERARRLVTAALAGAERGEQLIRQLLALSRQKSGDPHRVEPAALVSDMAELLRQTVGPAVELILDFGPEAMPVFADPGQLEAALLNLAINARDAMPKGGRLTIELRNVALTAEDLSNAALTAEDVSNAALTAADLSPSSEAEPGNYVMIAIRDTGIGMPREIAARVFEPFFTTKPEGSGTGLGLTMVHRLARQACGHVRIDSALGRGTAIKLFLPWAPGAKPGASEAQPADTNG